ncbi:MAG TPA: PhoH family protein [Flavobacteriales bacterium]|nr:PhoH family protein [Flavobacteriales bacterium]HIN74244.1 PhoH family protein [Gammaproteobacteria bacterium]
MDRKKGNKKKIYVLDTSVILHDHNAINNFGEHDVAIPITVLEELDNFKRGNENKNFEAREFIRRIDKLSKSNTLQDWIPLNGKGKGKFKIVMNGNGNLNVDAEKVFDERKPDHKILNAALSLKKEEKNSIVILVTKDINLRIKAKALNINAEDYETGNVKDLTDLYMGKEQINNIPSNVIQNIMEKGYLEEDTAGIKNKIDNHYYILKNGKSSSLAFFNPENRHFERVASQESYGIVPRNAEQTFALHAILNPNIRLVTLQGVAGTGKTLLALAGAIQQRKRYKQIVLARPIVPLSNKDIGYLPGDVNEKIDPYMEPLWDNLNFIKNQFSDNDRKHRLIVEMQKNSKIIITPLTYIRGRSLSNIIFIVDEAQNLTPHEVKTIITRAGENSKIIFTGDVNQIDSPYLDEHSNGLTYIIDRLKGNPLFAHVTLERGERSELANLANELL